MQEQTQRRPTPEEVKRILQESILQHYPNPERKGCPGRATIKEIAEQRLPFEDSRWSHVERCSPCYREFLDFRHEFKATQSGEKPQVKWLTEAASLLLIVSLSAWFAKDHFGKLKPYTALGTATQTETHAAVESTESALNAALDLRNQSVTRSAIKQEIPASQIPRIPRGRLSLAITLPFGAEAGDYTVRLLKSETDSTDLGTFSGNASIQQGFTILPISADLSKFEPGKYVLAIRHSEDAWSFFQFVLR